MLLQSNIFMPKQIFATGLITLIKLNVPGTRGNKAYIQNLD